MKKLNLICIAQSFIGKNEKNPGIAVHSYLCFYLWALKRCEGLCCLPLHGFGIKDGRTRVVITFLYASSILIDLLQWICITFEVISKWTGEQQKLHKRTQS